LSDAGIPGNIGNARLRVSLFGEEFQGHGQQFGARGFASRGERFQSFRFAAMN
jgi:hypothetical protein